MYSKSTEMGSCRVTILLGFIAVLTSHVNVYANNFNILTEPEQVYQHLEDPSIVIVDVRSPEMYHESHITGAVSVPVKQTFAIGNRADLVASVAELRNLFSSSGIQNESKIVLYGDNKFKDVSRVFWVLEMYGFKYVSVMNAGFSEWQSMGLPTSNKKTHKPKSTVIPDIKPERFATLLNVLSSLYKDNHILIDGRPENEYMGLESKTAVYGHIPGAINIPSSTNLSVDGTRLIPNQDLEMLYKDIDKDKFITVYCNKGKQSAIIYLSLRRLGANVRAYDGSWYEWSLYPDLPKSTYREDKPDIM